MFISCTIFSGFSIKAILALYIELENVLFFFWEIEITSFKVVNICSMTV